MTSCLPSLRNFEVEGNTARCKRSSCVQSSASIAEAQSRTRLNYTHVITADDVKVAEELAAILEHEFLAQDLPKLPPNAETASELISEAV